MILDFAFAVGMVEIALIVGGGTLNVPYLPVAHPPAIHDLRARSPAYGGDGDGPGGDRAGRPTAGGGSTRRRRALLPASGFRQLTRIGTALCTVVDHPAAGRDGAVLAVPARRGDPERVDHQVVHLQFLGRRLARSCIPSRYRSRPSRSRCVITHAAVVRDGPLGLRRQAADQPDDPAAHAAARHRAGPGAGGAVQHRLPVPDPGPGVPDRRARRRSSCRSSRGR